MSKKKSNKGIHRHRFKANPNEAKLASLWDKQCTYHSTLDYLLGDGAKPAEPSDRDRQVAATVIQWLGSPVGQCFLEDAGFVHKSRI